VVGHSDIVYGPLLHGCTTILYEGKPVGTPDAGAFWRVIADHSVNVMFTAPTAIRAIKREDPPGDRVPEHDMEAFRTLFLAGERLGPDTLGWAQRNLERPVIDHWWQTESGWPMAGIRQGRGASCVALPKAQPGASRGAPSWRGRSALPVPRLCLGGSGATGAPRSRPGTARFGADDFAQLDLKSSAGCSVWQFPGLAVQDFYGRTVT
jgi:hypothetical protein